MLKKILLSQINTGKCFPSRGQSQTLQPNLVEVKSSSGKIHSPQNILLALTVSGFPVTQC